MAFFPCFSACICRAHLPTLWIFPWCATETWLWSGAESARSCPHGHCGSNSVAKCHRHGNILVKNKWMCPNRLPTFCLQIQRGEDDLFIESDLITELEWLLYQVIRDKLYSRMTIPALVKTEVLHKYYTVYVVLLITSRIICRPNRHLGYHWIIIQSVRLQHLVYLHIHSLWMDHQI